MQKLVFSNIFYFSKYRESGLIKKDEARSSESVNDSESKEKNKLSSSDGRINIISQK